MTKSSATVKTLCVLITYSAILHTKMTQAARA